MNESNTNFKDLDKSQEVSTSSKAPKQNKMKRTSWLAISSLACILLGIGFLLVPSLSFVMRLRIAFCFSLATLVLGIIAFIIIGFHGEKLKGRGYAFAAVVLALFYILMGMNSLARFMDYKAKYNLRKLRKALIVYAEDRDKHLPVANNWCDLLMRYDKSLSRGNFKHPLIKGSECDFAFNKNLDGLRLADIPGDVILLFGAKGGWNLNGGVELLKERPNLDTYILFVNGDISPYSFSDEGIQKWDDDLEKTSIEPLRWKP
ncbi:MAG: hypothetical protein ACYS1A_14390 [Planctomycetota bacterium]|jgi:hypothetical protein